jgi:dihydroceramidase
VEARVHRYVSPHGASCSSLYRAHLSVTDRVTGIGLFLTGFFIWNMDNIYCRHLRTARNHILLPWAVVLEGHGWWHLFTALGKTAAQAFSHGPYLS